MNASLAQSDSMDQTVIAACLAATVGIVRNCVQLSVMEVVTRNPDTVPGVRMDSMDQGVNMHVDIVLITLVITQMDTALVKLVIMESSANSSARRALTTIVIL